MDEFSVKLVPVPGWFWRFFIDNVSGVEVKLYVNEMRIELDEFIKVSFLLNERLQFYSDFLKNNIPFDIPKSCGSVYLIGNTIFIQRETIFSEWKYFVKSRKYLQEIMIHELKKSLPNMRLPRIIPE